MTGERIPERLVCEDCGSVLTAIERHYYGHRCEACETAWSDRMTAWMKGGEDPELDAAYSVPAPVLQ